MGLVPVLYRTLLRSAKVADRLVSAIPGPAPSILRFRAAVSAHFLQPSDVPVPVHSETDLPWPAGGANPLDYGAGATNPATGAPVTAVEAVRKAFRSTGYAD
eukprot:1176210-Prorocentrum_minimum.AAC.1